MPPSSWLFPLVALACAPTPTTCADRGDAALRGYCLIQEVQHAGSPAEAVATCAGAGSWEAACREVWLIGAVRPGSAYTAAELLPVAATDDARMLVLDARPDADPLVQLAACEASTGRYVCDCTWHAMARWARTRPDEGEIRRVAAFAGPCAQQHAEGLGMAMGCSGTQGCASARDPRACETERTAIVRDPRTCIAPMGPLGL